MTLSLVLLGSAQVLVDEHPVTFESNWARALLIYLTLEANRPHQREALAALFWPDKPQTTAFTNLRQTLARLRRELPSNVNAALVATKQTLELRRDGDSDIRVDAAEFDALLAEVARHTHTGTSGHADGALCADCVARLRRATELYRGEFLKGIPLKLSEPFEAWMLLQREHRHQHALRASQWLTQHYESIADYAHMRRHAARQLELEPLLEEAHGQLMRALAYAGDRAGALAQYHACERVLEAELGIGPGNELRASYERIAAGEFAPSSLSAHLPRHTLPRQLTPFIGRESELADIASRLEDEENRLLTLTGPGGMGKTRLAIEAARARLDEYRDGAFFVSLASISEPGEIAAAVCAGIGLSLPLPTQGMDARAVLLRFLADKQALLILDNFEHVIAGVAVVLEILQAAPTLQIIVTSRERLNVRGEHVLTVGGMAYGHVDATSAAQPSAVQLFVQNARRVRADFALMPTNAPDVLRICQRVGGMPLGLELAAAWCESMTVCEIADEIERSADFLTADWRDMPERQRSLRAVFDWSWTLLGPEEKRVLSGLSVFRGGFTRAAAGAVTSATLRVLSDLMRKSLLRLSETSGAAGRYEMHELIRQFAHEKLHAAPADESGMNDRHSDYFLNFMAEQEVVLHGQTSKDALMAIQAEIANVRQAWSWALDRHDLDGLDRSVQTLAAFYAQTDMNEGLHIFERTAEQLRAQPGSSRCQRALAKVLANLVAFQFPQGNFQAATASAQKAIALARLCDAPLVEAAALVHWADSLSRIPDLDAAQQRAEEALALATQPQLAVNATGAEQLLWRMIHASSLLRLSKTHELQGDFDRASDYAEQALRVCEQLNLRYQASALDRLGEILRRQGHYELSLRRRLQALNVTQQSGDLDTEIAILNNLGDVYFCLGEYALAISTLERGIQLCHAIGNRWMESNMYDTLAHVCLNLNQPDQALACAKRAEHMIRGYYLNSLGLAYEQLNQFDDAERRLRDAVTWWQTQSPNAAITEAYAGLARLMLSRGEIAHAMGWVEQILPLLNASMLADGMNPVLVYETCVKVLAANADPRADGVLRAAHMLITDLAARISDPALRQSFLVIPAHREIEMAFTHRAELHARLSPPRYAS